jgi:hypothetical protein
VNDQMPDFEPPAPMFEDPKPKKERKKPSKRRKVAKKAGITVPGLAWHAPKSRARKVKATDGRLKANRKPRKRRVVYVKPVYERAAGEQTMSDAFYGVLATLIDMEKAERDTVAIYMKRLFK